MIAVGKHRLSAEFVEIGSGDEAYVAASADRHESRGFDLAVSGFDDAGAAEAVR